MTIRADLQQLLTKGMRDSLSIQLGGSMLRELNSCQRAWREINGEKVWYRLVPDPYPNESTHDQTGVHLK